jgi:TPR repeat protein/ankyrin repeat protein
MIEFMERKVELLALEKAASLLGITGNGDVVAQFSLGCMYISGEHGVAQDLQKGMGLLEKAAEQGSAEAQAILKGILQKSEKEDANAQFKLNKEPELLEKAAKGDSEAQYELGCLYVAQDTKKGEGLLEKAAEQGHAGAQYKIGMIYSRGLGGVTQDTQKGKGLLEKAAEQGHAEAQCALGSMYPHGKYGEAKKRELVEKKWELLEKAGNGDAGAQCTLGWMYVSGDGVAQDKLKGRGLLEKAAGQGHATAQCALSIMYPHDEYGEAKKTELVEKKWELLEKARNGDAGAQCTLGWMYVSGDGVAQDKLKGRGLLEKAVGQGHAGAQYALSMIYFSGLGGVSQDKPKGRGLLEKAAEQGHAGAQYALGSMYLHGDHGVAQDTQKAKGLLEKAAEQGHAQAAYYLSQMYCMVCMLGQHLPQDRQAAKRFWQNAAWGFEKDGASEASWCEDAHLEALALICAAQTGDIKTLQRMSHTLLVLEVELDSSGRTVLHVAAAEGTLEVVQWLVAKGVCLETADQAGSTALHFSVQHKHTAMTEWLVTKGAKVDSRDMFGKTPLFSAAQKGCVAEMKFLVANGADIAATSIVGSTVVHSAAMLGQLAVMKWLAKQDGIDMAATSAATHDSNTLTALHIAVICGHLAVVNWMIKTLVVDAGTLGAFATPTTNEAMPLHPLAIVAEREARGETRRQATLAHEKLVKQSAKVGTLMLAATSMYEKKDWRSAKQMALQVLAMFPHFDAAHTLVRNVDKIDERLAEEMMASLLEGEADGAGAGKGGKRGPPQDLSPCTPLFSPPIQNRVSSLHSPVGSMEAELAKLRVGDGKKAPFSAAPFVFASNSAEDSALPPLTTAPFTFGGGSQDTAAAATKTAALAPVGVDGKNQSDITGARHFLSKVKVSRCCATTMRTALTRCCVTHCCATTMHTALA